jgi:hypothetical protein
MSNFIELRDQAEREIRAHLRSSSPDSAHYFVMDSTNYFVEHGAILLAALRLWAVARHEIRRSKISCFDPRLTSIWTAYPTQPFPAWRRLGGSGPRRV